MLCFMKTLRGVFEHVICHRLGFWCHSQSVQPSTESNKSTADAIVHYAAGQFQTMSYVINQKKNRIYKSMCSAIMYADYVALPAFARRTPRWSISPAGRATVANRDGTGSHFVTQRPSDPGIQRPGDLVDPVTLCYNELQMSTYVWRSILRPKNF